MRIAYQGEPGAYSEAAALRFNPSADVLPRKSFEAVFVAVEEGAATHGILPIENTIGGTIHENYDLLLRRVYSHPQGLRQCERFLRTLDVELVATYDTAGSAKMIQEGQLKGTGAIASERAAEMFKLSVLEAGVQDFAGNTTRFILVGRDNTPLGEANKTTVVFTVANIAGALFKALSVFALRDIDLTKLESRPIPERPFEYLFYIDLDASRDELPCERALMHLAEFAPSVRTLGSYPRWQDPE